MRLFRRFRPYLINGTAAGSRVASAVFGVLQLSLAVRILSPAEYGSAAVAIAFAAIVSLAFEPPILGYQRLGSHKRETSVDEARAMARISLLLMSGVGLVLAGVVGALEDDATYYMATAIWTLSLVQLRWVTVQFLNWGELNRFTVVVVLNSAARAGGFLAGAAGFGSATAALLLGGLGSLATTTLVSPSRELRGHSARDVLKPLLSIGGMMTFVSAANVLVSQGVFISGSHFLDPDTFAAFAAQVSLAQASFLVTAGFLAVVGFPRVKATWDSGFEPQAERAVARYAWLTLAGGLCFAAVWYAAGDWITTLFLSAGYAGNQVPTVVTAAMCLGTMAQVVGWIPQLRFQQRALALRAWLAAVVFLGGAVVLGPGWGIPGILGPFVVAAGVQALLVAWISKPPGALPLAGATIALAGLGTSVAFL